MTDWKSCDNCNFHVGRDYYCNKLIARDANEGRYWLPNCLMFHEWKPAPCPSCGGALSITREHNGRRYRHCYSCHFEFFEEE